MGWWGAGDAIEPGEWAFDFRVGGRDVAEGKFWADGPNREKGSRGLLQALGNYLA